jgi:hypothetical protein
MSGKRSRGSRAGKRVQRGHAQFTAREEELEDKEFKRITAEAYELYAEALFHRTGLRALPRDRGRWGHFITPLPNEWFLEITWGDDGPPLPPSYEEGDRCIFWLITPDGLYATEDNVDFQGSPESIKWMIVGYAARLLWKHLDEILGPAAAKERRKGLPRPWGQKIKALVERGDFAQPESGS